MNEACPECNFFSLMSMRKDPVRNRRRAPMGQSYFVHLLLIASSSFLLSFITCEAKSVRIVGEAQVALIDTDTAAEEVFETAKLVIVTDGISYGISCDSVLNGSEAKEEVSSDGLDLFMINSDITPWNPAGKSVTGSAYPGRFPRACNPTVQAAWMAYCSKNYFASTNQTTGLELGVVTLSMSPPDSVTNILTFGPESALPQKIKGYGRNEVFFTGNPVPRDIPQYPHGYKAWEFTAADRILVGDELLPQSFTLEGYLPWLENTNIMQVEEVEPLRKITFRVRSIEPIDGATDPLPIVKIPDLAIVDLRFTNLIGKHFVVEHTNPTNGWPVRTDPKNPSLGYKNAESEAKRMALESGFVARSKSKKVWAVRLGILGTNALILIGIASAVVKHKKQKTKGV